MLAKCQLGALLWQARALCSSAACPWVTSRLYRLPLPFQVAQLHKDAPGKGDHQDARLSIEAWPGFKKDVAEATTLPASWYTSAAVLKQEKQNVFGNAWQMVGRTGQLQLPGDFFTGSVLSAQFVVCRGEDGELRAFHNECRHHAAAVAQGCGNNAEGLFQCPYHGWTYDLQGRLRKATRLKGIKNFKASDYGLHPICVDTWGQLVFIHLGKTQQHSSGSTQHRHDSVKEWLGAGGEAMEQLGMRDALVHVARREYHINSNWKVFCDNYLDGGYHVQFAHKALAQQLDLNNYSSSLHDVLSIQTCTPAEKQRGAVAAEPPAAQARLAGRPPAYAFVYPNCMINRYGPWMDTNVVLPLDARTPHRCKVVFDYFLELGTLAQQGQLQQQQQQQQSLPLEGTGHDSSAPQSPASQSPGGKLSTAAFIEESLAASDKVQQEDIALCEAVQKGLEDDAYGVGRYAPGVEAPMHHFHQLLYAAVMGVDGNSDVCLPAKST